MRNLRSVLCILVAGLLWGACAAAPPLAPAVRASSQGWQPVFTATQTEATIIFDPQALAPGQETTTVGLVGTFNSWSVSQLWPLRKQADGTWRATFTRAHIGVPGNSGLPEFQFILNGDNRITAAAAPAGQRFANNFVLLWPGISEATVEERDRQNQVVKTRYESEEELTNFRGLTGGRLAQGRLYRSYHPFLSSRDLPTEKDRLAGVQRLMEQRHVAAVINLSEGAEVLKDRQAPGYYKELAARGCILFAPTHYNVVYFASDSPEFTEELRKVLTFVASTPGPYMVHCRLGTDRTGVVSAILEGLAGVPWPTILEDFQKSNALGIQEYRDPEMLTYSLTKFLGRGPGELPDLAAALRARLVEKGLDPGTVDRAVAHLTQ